MGGDEGTARRSERAGNSANARAPGSESGREHTESDRRKIIIVHRQAWRRILVRAVKEAWRTHRRRSKILCSHVLRILCVEIAWDRFDWTARSRSGVATPARLLMARSIWSCVVAVAGLSPRPARAL